MVLIYVEHSNGEFKKTAFESITYGKKAAELLGSSCEILVLGNVDVQELDKTGVSKIHRVTDVPADFDSQLYSKVIAEMAEKTEASVMVLAQTANGRSLGGRLSIRMEAGLASGISTLPSISDGFTVERSVFSGKAIATLEMLTSKKILMLMPNSFQIETQSVDLKVIDHSLGFTDPKVRVIETKTVKGSIPLPEAEKVVSAGRGMKGPENWHIIEELANTLGASLACSRPVADTGWRPHHEHVGQTGIAIRPNLYIAIGISGAIQHLAGVNNSKVIVVINKDPEAPFFKAADYGVCADLFDVVPRLNSALKKFYENV